MEDKMKSDPDEKLFSAIEEKFIDFAVFRKTESMQN